MGIKLIWCSNLKNIHWSGMYNFGTNSGLYRIIQDYTGAIRFTVDAIKPFIFLFPLQVILTHCFAVYLIRDLYGPVGA